MKRVRDWFDSGQLVKPSSEALNFVDLVRALALLAGAGGVRSGPGVDALCRMIGSARHYLFVLVDGMGLHQLESLPRDSFLRSSVAARLQAVFLSTTATALTTLGTGEWPSSHGVPGWWTYLEKRQICAVTLPFTERSTGQPLEGLGLTAPDLFPVPSFWPGLKHRPLSILPDEIAESTYSRYLSGGTARLAYTGLADAFEKAEESVLGASGPSLTYLYLPQLDTLCHRRGTGNQRAHDLLLQLDRYLLRLFKSTARRARILISADHGHADVPRDRLFVLSADDSITSHIRSLPSGEPNVPIFHVRPGREARFEEEFNQRFGEFFALVTPREIEDLRLLGPTPVSRTMKARLGTFVGICGEPSAVCIGPPGESGSRNIGFHGGLTGAEMHVPLIIPG